MENFGGVGWGAACGGGKGLRSRIIARQRRTPLNASAVTPPRLSLSPPAYLLSTTCLPLGGMRSININNITRLLCASSLTISRHRLARGIAASAALEWTVGVASSLAGAYLSLTSSARCHNFPRGHKTLPLLCFALTALRAASSGLAHIKITQTSPGSIDGGYPGWRAAAGACIGLLCRKRGMVCVPERHYIASNNNCDAASRAASPWRLRRRASNSSTCSTACLMFVNASRRSSWRISTAPHIYQHSGKRRRRGTGTLAPARGAFNAAGEGRWDRADAGTCGSGGRRQRKAKPLLCCPRLREHLRSIFCALPRGASPGPRSLARHRFTHPHPHLPPVPAHPFGCLFCACKARWDHRCPSRPCRGASSPLHSLRVRHRMKNQQLTADEPRKPVDGQAACRLGLSLHGRQRHSIVCSR